MSEVNNFLIAEYDYDTDISVQRNEAYEMGIKKGREEGRWTRTLALARSFKDMGFPLDKIAQATGLTIDEIEKL